LVSQGGSLGDDTTVNGHTVNPIQVSQHSRAVRQRGLALKVAVQSKSLTPGMKAYAAWLAIQDAFPKSMERLKQAGLCLNTRVSRKNLKGLETRDDFINQVQVYREQEVTRVKAILERHLEVAVDAHMLGLKLAVSERDHRAIPKFTVPLIERAWPKVNEQQPHVPMIEIHIGQGQTMRLIEKPVEEIPDAEFEVVKD
jgi:hypothetical protein